MKKLLFCIIEIHLIYKIQIVTKVELLAVEQKFFCYWIFLIRILLYNFNVVRVLVLVQVPAEESISSSDGLWAIQAVEVVESTAHRIKVQVQEFKVESNLSRRSWETQIIKAYKLDPTKLGCFEMCDVNKTKI